MEKTKTQIRKELEMFRVAKRDALRAAKDLGYGYYVLGLIDKAKTEGEIEKIMIDARHGKYAFM